MRRYLLLSALLCCAPVAALASSVTYTVSGTFTSGANLGGTIAVDASGDVTGSLTSNPYSGPTLTYNDSSNFVPVFGVELASFVNSASDNTIYLELSALPGDSTATLCSTSYSCDGKTSDIYGYDSGHAGTTDYLASGSLTPVSATPEPSSLALLGSGVLGLACEVRRRIRRA